MRICLVILFLFFLLLNSRAQKIENVRALYQNDTLTILYDLTGKIKLDSIEVIISSPKTSKKYMFSFHGDINNEVKNGKDKKIWAYIYRDSFPEDGVTLKIRLKGWAKRTTKTKKRKKKPFVFFTKSPVNPRFTFSPGLGILLRSSEFSKIGQNVSGTFYYHPSGTFQIGLGVTYYNFLDSVKRFSSAHGLISTKYSFANYSLPGYLLMNYGYSLFNEGPVITAGLGYKNIIYGPINIDVSAQLHRFYGYFDFYALSLNAGISISASSRKRFKKEKVYKFKDFMVYAEAGANYFKKLSPNFSIDFAYKIAPNYTQGIGFSFESVNYKFKSEYKTHYYSEFYQENIEYVAGIVDYELNIYIVPFYLNGRLYLSTGRFRPFLLWKYGVTIYSKADKGELKKGFVGDLGFGFQSPINKKKAMIFSVGLKFFDNKYSYEGIENNFFGTFFFKTGIVF